MKLASNLRGRNNQIHARSKNSSYQKTNAPQARPMVKKELKDYMYFLGTAKQVSEYESTTLFIINHVKKGFEFGNDIASALDKLKEFEVSKPKPDLQVSTSDALSEKIVSDGQFELEFREKFAAYMKRKQNYENNRVKAYALIWERCARGMQVKIESRNNFENRIKNNPIELCKQ
jgi:hypothetical protein